MGSWAPTEPVGQGQSQRLWAGTERALARARERVAGRERGWARERRAGPIGLGQSQRLWLGQRTELGPEDRARARGFGQSQRERGWARERRLWTEPEREALARARGFGLGQLGWAGPGALALA